MGAGPSCRESGRSLVPRKGDIFCHPGGCNVAPEARNSTASGGCGAIRHPEGDTSLRPRGRKPRQRRGALSFFVRVGADDLAQPSAPSGALRMRKVVRPYTRSEMPRISYVKYSTGRNRATTQFTVRSGNPILRSPARAFLDCQCNNNTHNVTKCLSARKRYFRVQRLFFAYFFLARQKKVCPRSDSCGITARMALR